MLAYRVVPAPRLNALAAVGRMVRPGAVGGYDALAVLAVIAMVLSTDVERVPPALVRPLALVGSLWVCAAAAAWFVSLDAVGGRRLLVRRWVYLLPGVVSFVYEPFRERLLVMLLVPFVAALVRGPPTAPGRRRRGVRGVRPGQHGGGELVPAGGVGSGRPWPSPARASIPSCG